MKPLVEQCDFVVERYDDVLERCDWNLGNCEEEFPKKPVGRLLADSWPTGYRQVKKKERLPTG